MLAEALSRAADGQITVPARELINKVLAADPDEPRALFMSGLARYQDGDYAQAVIIWQRLLAISTPEAPWIGIVNKTLRGLPRMVTLPLTPRLRHQVRPAHQHPMQRRSPPPPT